MQIKKISIGQLEFDCRVSGDEQNELIIFLHGFPETSFMWSKIIDKLSSLGFYCMAPDMRGYSKNATPKGVKHYRMENLTQDILDIADTADKSNFHLIGHDWGAAIGWNIVYQNPNRILSWTALSIPHGKALGKAIKLNKEQQKKTSYIKYFILPYIPEVMIRKNDFEKFRKLWKHSSSEELEHYLSVFRRKQTLTAALNYYRANFRKGKSPSLGEIKSPTLFIWGNQDLAIGSFAVECNHKYMKGEYNFLELDAGHWLIQTNYAEVESAIIDHVTKYKTKF